MTVDGVNTIIFWDYDSTGLTSASTSVSTYELVKNIRAAISPFGSIKAFRAYTDWAQLSARGSNVRAELLSSGVALVDCPSDGRKDVHAKIMLTDIFIHAFDHAPPHTFVIITADRDLAYPVSLLRTRNYKVILICPSTTHISLVAQASAELDWTRVVLGIRGGILDDTDFLERPSGLKEPFPSSGLPRQQSSDTNHRPNHASDFRKTGLSHVGFSPDNHSSEPPGAENPSRPSRVRRNMTFSGPLEPDRFNVLGELGNGFTTPRPSRGPMGTFGDGPLFSRPRSRTAEQSRGDSAAPNIRYGNVNLTTPPIPSFIPSNVEPFSGTNGGLSASVKGKQRDLQPFEYFVPENTVPEETLESLTAIPVSGPVFGNSGESGMPQMTTSPLLPSEKSPSSRTPSRASSISSPSSSVQSDFSLLDPVEPSTVPTSAQSADKSDLTAKPSSALRDGRLEAMTSSAEASGSEDLNDIYKSTASQTEPAEPQSLSVVEPVGGPAKEDHEKVSVVAQSPGHPVPTSLSRPRYAPGSSNSTSIAESVAVISHQSSNSTSSLGNPTSPKPPSPPQVPAPATIGAPSGASKSAPPVPPTPKVSASTSAAATTTSNRLSTSASVPVTTTVPSIPTAFIPLVSVLRQEQRGQRAGGVEKSHLGSVLPARHPGVYKGAGSTTFKDYIAKAIQAGIVKDVYDKYGDQCVALLPQYK